MTLYNIHGFIISVTGPADKIFLKEYGWAIVNDANNVDLFVEPSKDKSDLPTKPAGCSKGMYLPFQNGEQTLWYEEGVPIHCVLMYCEALIHWSNKTFLHAGCVAKNGKAIIFTGTGNVGKTSIVLNLLNEGYEYLSDDWLIIGDGFAYPFPKLLHVFDYNLKNNTIATSVLGPKRYLYKPFFKIIELARKYSPHRYLRYGFETVKPMFSVDIKVINPRAKIASPSEISKIFYLERKNVPQVTTSNNISSEELARRMSHVTLYERNYLAKEYSMYVAVQGIRSQMMDNKLENNLKTMQNTFEKAPIFRTTIPIGFDLTKAKITSILNLE